MTLGLCELLWMRIVLEDLKIAVREPIRLFCDNQSAITITHNPVQHNRAKHIEINRHFIKEMLEKSIIQIPYIPSEQQVADCLAKGLVTKRFEDPICKLE